MLGFLQRAVLPLTVFVTGGCVLVIEIVATRILAPYFGNTIYSVSSVISVVLAALSVGYWFGGRLADRYPSKKLFFMIIACSGVLVLGMQLVQLLFLPTLGYALPLTVGPLIVSCLLFFVPSFVLGTLSPFAVALKQRETKGQGVGTAAGEIFFFSTLGSIAGSLAAGFALIPFFGVQAIITGVGVVLFLLGAIPLVVLGIGRRTTALLTMSLGAGLLFVAAHSSSANVLYSRDGVYERIVIADGTYHGHPTRFLTQDTSNSAAMFLDSPELAYEYTKYYGLYEAFVSEPKLALGIGGGAYSVPKALLAESPTIKVDVSEIEPSLVPLSKQYFDLEDNPRLTHHIADGRRMLHDTPHRYDVIFGDAYHSMYSVPAHLTTKEFMQLVHDRLTDDGVFIANLIGSLRQESPSFLWSEVRTMQQVFPEVYMFAVQSPVSDEVQNIIVVGSKQRQRLDPFAAVWREAKHQVVREMAGHYVDTRSLSLAEHAVLTDDYAPVDYFASKLLPRR